MTTRARMDTPTAPWHRVDITTRLRRYRRARPKIILQLGEHVTLELHTGQAVQLINAIADALEN